MTKDHPETVTSGNGSTFTVDAVQRLRVDSLYGKKRHYNAADRTQCRHSQLGVPAFILNIVLGSYLVGAASAKWPDFINWFGAVFAAMAALLTGLQILFNYERKASQHRGIGTRYLAVAKECGRMIAYHKDGTLTPEGLRRQFEHVAKQYDQITVDAEECPTKNVDFEKAREGFGDDEEKYTEEELLHTGE